MAQLGVIWADGIWNTAVWNTAIWAQTSTPDVTAPTLSSATVAANGASLTLAFDESVSAGAGGYGGFTLTPTNGGAAAALTYASGTGTANLVYTISRALTRNETGTIAYTQPGDGIQDTAPFPNDLASFSGAAITNNSTQNNAPTNMSLSRSSVATTAGLNGVVGAINTSDADPGDTFTYSLVAGTGDTNNASFNINGANLRCNDPATLGVGSYSVRIQTSDGALTYAEAFTVTVALPSAGGLIVNDIVTDCVFDMTAAVSL